MLVKKIQIGILLLSLVCGAAFAQSFGVEEVRRLAEGGDAEAQNNLGVMYHIGQGVATHN